MKLRTDKIVPVGIKAKKHFNILGVCLGTFAGESFFTYLIKLSNFRSAYRNLAQGGTINEVSFCDVTENSFMFSLVVLMFFIGLALSNYLISRKSGGSNPIYTFKRIPQWWEIHVRCLAVPVIGALAMAVEVILLCGLYYLIYRLAIPDEILPHSFDGAFINGLKWGFK